MIWACGGDDNVNLDGGNDATTTDGGGNDTGTKDTGTNDTGTNDSGSTDGGTKDVSVSIDCLKPADCVDGGDPDAAYPPADAGVVCCATVQTSGGFPQCSLDSISTACATPANCPSSVSFQSCTTDTLRACHAASECTETQYNMCCKFQTDAGTAQVCANQLIANAFNGTCL